MKNLVFRSLFFLFTLLFLNSSQLLATDYFWVGGTGNWSDLTHWATTSGGSTLHTSLPGETDDVYFDVNSFSADGQEVNIDGTIIRVKDFIATDVAFNISFTGVAPVPNIEIYGSFDAASNISFELPGVLLDFNSDVSGQSVNIASGFLNSSEDASVRFSGEGSWTIDNGFSAHSLNVTQGEIIFGANTFNFKNVYLWYSFDKLLNLTDATLNIEKWTMNNQDFVLIIPNNSTINFSDEFQGFGKTYGTVNVTTPTGFANDIEISGSNTFQNFTVVQGVNLLVDANTTQTILGNLTFNGTSSEVITFESSTKGEKFNFDGTGINISGEYVNISESDFLGTATFALENSLLIGDVNGWEINSVPAPTENGSFFYSKIFADSLYIDLDPGDGAERIVFMRQGGFPDITTVDDVAYTADQSFGDGELVGTDTYVVYQGSDDLVKIEGLLPGTEYSIAVREVNRTPDNSSIKYYVPSTGFSKSATTADSGNIYLSYNGTATVNGGEQFFDDGGKGFYFPNRENVLTLNSAEAGKAIKLTFNEFETRSYEELRIFDGTDTTANLITSLSGTSLSLPRTVTSTGENMTLKFTSSDFEPYAFDLDGWVADVNLIFPAPTIRSSAGITNSFTDTSIDFSFTKGNGDQRLIVAKQGGGGISFSPTENTNYTADSNFAMGQDLGNGEFVVAAGDINSLTLNNLTAKSDYLIKIWEYNKSGSLISYLLGGYQFTINNSEVAPEDIDHSYSISLSNRQTDYIKVEKLKFRINLQTEEYSPDRKFLVLASENEIGKSDLQNKLIDDYRVTGNSQYGLGDEVLPGVFAVGKSSSYTYEISNLNPNTDYYVNVIYLEENGAGTRYGLENIGVKVFRTKESNAIFLGETYTSINSTKILYNTTGFGKVEQEDIVKTFYPENSDEKLYFLASIINLGNSSVFPFIIYDGENTSAPILADYSGNNTSNNSGFSLLKATNSSGALTIKYGYRGGGYGSNGNPIGFRAFLYPYNGSASEPLKTIQNLVASNLNKTSVDFDWTRGDGEKLLIALTRKGFKEDEIVDGLDYDKIDSSEGNEIVFLGTDSTLSLTNLIAGTKYTLRFYEFNGNDNNINYGEVVNYSFITESNRPEGASSKLDFEILDSETVRLNWSSGDGERRIVVANTYSVPFEKHDFDGKEFYPDSDYAAARTYTNSDFKEFKVLYNGTGNSVEITGLSNQAYYAFRVLDYNGNGLTTNYLSSEESKFSLIPPAPTENITDGQIYDITATTAKVKWTRKNNYSLIFVSKYPTASLELDSGFNENYSINYFKQNDGYIAYAGARFSGDIDLRNLSANTTYYISFYTANYLNGSDAYNIKKANIPQSSFTTASTQKFYWVGGDGNWTDVAHWAKSSGGQALHDTIPSEKSEVYFDQNSFDEEDQGFVNLFNNRNISIYSISAENLSKSILFNSYDSINDREENIYLTIAANINLSDSVIINLSQINLNGVEDVNQINLANDWIGIPSISIYQRLRSNEILIDSFPRKISTFRAYNANISFIALPDTLSASFWTDIKSKFNQELKCLQTDAFQSDQRVSKLFATGEGYQYLRIEGSPVVDSLFLSGKDLLISPSSNLTVNAISSEESFKIYSGSRRSQGYITTEKDSLVVENVEIYDNHTLGDAKFIAKNSLLYSNVEGWELSGVRNPSIPDSPGYVYLSSGDSTTVEVAWETLRSGEPLLMIWKDKRGDEKPQENNIYKYTNDFLSAETLGLARVINLKDKNSLTLKNLSPDTNYFLELYTFNQYDTLVKYSVYSSYFNFRTAKIKDAYFGTVSEDKIITALDQQVYSLEGVGFTYSENGSQLLTVLPDSPSKKVALSYDSDDYTGMRMAIYTSGSDENIFSEYLSGIETDTAFISRNVGEGLKIYLNKNGYSSAAPTPPKFTIQSVFGELSAEPNEALNDFNIKEVTGSSITLEWDELSEQSVLIVANKGSYNAKFKPADYLKYAANAEYGKSDKAYFENEYIVFSGRGSEVTITNLESNTYYSFTVFTYSNEDGKDPHYSEISSSVTQETLYSIPDTDLAFFEFGKAKSNDVSFIAEGFDADGIMVVASTNKDFQFTPSDSMRFNSLNESMGFNNADELADGVKLLYTGKNRTINYQSGGFTENTNYYIKIYAFNGVSNNNLFQKDFIKYDSIKTTDATFRIENLSTEIACVNSRINITYDYTGINYQDQLAKVIISADSNMIDFDELEITDSSNFKFEVLLSDNLSVGEYFLAVVPETGNFEILSKPISLDKTETPEIVRKEQYLISNDRNNTLWFRNDEEISGSANIDSLALENEGLYYQVKTFANCEYVSNSVLVKPRITLPKDTSTYCFNTEIQISYENEFGNLTDSLNYVAILINESSQTFEVDIDTIDLDNRVFTFGLPEDFSTGSYGITLNTNENLIESDTSYLSIEKPEPAVITVSENQLSSNYEEGNQWFFNGEPIPGATEQTVTTDRTGSYSLEVTAGSCLLTAEVGNVLSNESPFASVGLKLYPNPVRQQLSLVNNGNELGHSHVRILDAKGVEIQEFNINFNIESGVYLDVHDYANGMYFIIIESENIKAVDRFIKK